MVAGAHPWRRRQPGWGRAGAVARPLICWLQRHGKPFIPSRAPAIRSFDQTPHTYDTRLAVPAHPRRSGPLFRPACFPPPSVSHESGEPLVVTLRQPSGAAWWLSEGRRGPAQRGAKQRARARKGACVSLQPAPRDSSLQHAVQPPGAALAVAARLRQRGREQRTARSSAVGGAVARGGRVSARLECAARCWADAPPAPLLQSQHPSYNHSRSHEHGAPEAAAQRAGGAKPGACRWGRLSMHACACMGVLTPSFNCAWSRWRERMELARGQAHHAAAVRSIAAAALNSCFADACAANRPWHCCSLPCCRSHRWHQAHTHVPQPHPAPPQADAAAAAEAPAPQAAAAAAATPAQAPSEVCVRDTVCAVTMCWLRRLLWAVCVVCRMCVCT